MDRRGSGELIGELLEQERERFARRAGASRDLAGRASNALAGGVTSFAAFSTAGRAPRGEPRPPALGDTRLDDVFQATVEATEEAVLNSLWRAETTTGREGRVVEALPHEPVLELLASHGRLRG